jgi:uncharacterized 2Fe-2S/4Fe-4S cluster protein (DUF4445 family)
LDGEEIDRTDGPIHGLAMDLGTTTVVIRLWNLETGEVVADASLRIRNGWWFRGDGADSL